MFCAILSRYTLILPSEGKKKYTKQKRNNIRKKNTQTTNYIKIACKQVDFLSFIYKYLCTCIMKTTIELILFSQYYYLIICKDNLSRAISSE